MALKDITLGQYFPGNSIVHRLDPRTKLIAVVLPNTRGQSPPTAPLATSRRIRTLVTHR